MTSEAARPTESKRIVGWPAGISTWQLWIQIIRLLHAYSVRVRNRAESAQASSERIIATATNRLASEAAVWIEDAAVGTDEISARATTDEASVAAAWHDKWVANDTWPITGGSEERISARLRLYYRLHRLRSLQIWREATNKHGALALL